MKIAVIGGGIAGLVTAWLLEEKHEVFLFERRDRLGGHAFTNYLEIQGEKIAIETGFEFFSDSMFACLGKLLKILALPVSTYPLTYTFHSAHNQIPILLPPFGRATFPWQTLAPEQLFTLVQFEYVIAKSRHIVSHGNTALTLKQFADSLLITESFKTGFLYPFLAAGWGVPIAEFIEFAAYDILTWIVKNAPSGLKPSYWNEIEQGVSAYIAALARQLASTRVKLSADITSIAHNNGYLIFEATRQTTQVDAIILATNAHQASKLLQHIPRAHELCDALKTIEYFKTTIALHGDTRWMPSNRSAWSVANVYHDGISSALTIYKPWKSSVPVFRSWLMQDKISPSNMPKPLYALEHFYHAKVTPTYFEAQKKIQKLQGINQIWLAGVYTAGIDSHESAIVSAINIAKQLAPHAKRLSLLGVTSES